MVILDTNVVSEPLKLLPEPVVLAWLDSQAPETPYLTTFNLAELLTGIEALPQGRRRTGLHQALTTQMMPLFKGQILAFDEKSAEAFALVYDGAKAAGNRISFADGAIAAIASAYKFLVATRNVRNFRGTGVEVINP